MKSDLIFKRIIINAAGLMVLSIFLLYFFTNNTLYCIISSGAALATIAGFIIMIKTFDKQIINKRGMILVLFFVKLIVLSVIYFLLAKHSLMSVISFTIGIMVVVGGIMIEGIFQIYKGLFNGRA